jgi:hypothetical protein
MGVTAVAVRSGRDPAARDLAHRDRAIVVSYASYWLLTR